VGQLGKEAVAAVGISFPIVFLIVAIGSGIGMAGSILVAQYKGKNDQANIDFISTQTMISMFLLGLIFTILGVFLTEPLILLMGVEKEVVPLATSYLFISFLTTLFTFVYSAFASLLRGTGEVKIPLIIVLITVIINFLLDPLFIFGYGIIPASGVAGAAWATFITTGISMLIGLFILFEGKSGIHIKRNCLKPDFKTFKKLFLIGWPSSIEFFSHSIGMLVLTIIATTYETIILASLTLGLRIFSFVFMPALSISIAVSTIVGQYIGANKSEYVGKILKQASIISFIGLTILGILLFIFAEIIVSVFVPGEIEVIQNASTLIRLMSLTFGFLGIMTVMVGSVRGAGATKKAMALSILFLIFQVGFALVFTPILGVIGIWIAFPCAIIFNCGIAVFYAKKMNWKKSRLF
jgi:putative MATE family efflux protein